MEKLITASTLRNFAYTNEHICQKPIRGIVLSFFGLNCTRMLHEDDDAGVDFAQRGILYVVPYLDPWSWMNRQAVSITDEMMDVLFQTHGLPEDTPIVSTGGSMGGLAALVYTAHAKRTPAACVANCPVCDLPYHFTERPDLPRTLYSAFWSYEGTMEDAMRQSSPLHLAQLGQMPSIRYTIFHCEQDQSVNKEKHSDRFVSAMDGHILTYYTVPEKGHCDLTPEMQKRYRAAAWEGIEA